MCADCLEKQRIESREKRAWFKSMGICPHCGKNAIMGDEKICFECAAKKYEDNLRRRRKNPEAHRKTTAKANARMKARRKEKGICVTCGKRKAEEGKSRCAFCNEQERKRAFEYRCRKTGDYIPRSERVAYGLCYVCGTPLDSDKRVCSECATKLSRNFKVWGHCENHIWITKRGNYERKRVSETSKQDK